MVVADNSHNRYFCQRCDEIEDHEHWHDAAHGIEGTHMAGTERYVCKACWIITHASDETANHFPWQLDK